MLAFPAKLFLCNRYCAHYQHSYCSNYYDELGTSGLCDWCQSEEKGGFCWKRMEKKEGGNLNRRESSGSKKHKEGLESRDKGKSSDNASSSRLANRRYKLLKDVMC